MIIHLQEISVSVAKENYKYGLLEQVRFVDFNTCLYILTLRAQGTIIKYPYRLLDKYAQKYIN